MILEIAILFTLFLSHYLGDYPPFSLPFQEAKKTGKLYFDILCHGVVHGGFMFVFLVIFSVNFPVAVCLFLFEVITHTAIDVLKGRMNVWFPVVSNPQNKSYWFVFGLDQFLHTLVIIIIYFIAIQNLTR